MGLQHSRPSVLRGLSIAATSALVIIVTAAMASRPVEAAAQMLTVTTTLDGHQGTGAACGSPAAAGKCTLRAAIELAGRASGDTIALPAGTYDLDSGLGFLEVRSGMTITGAGPTSTVVDGGQATGVFGVDATASPVAVSGLTVRNGMVTGSNASGADIANDGTLSLADVVVTGGSAAQGMGGGIASDGPLTLSDVVVSDNHAGDGGGLALVGNVKTTITRSTISDNSADGVQLGIPGLRQVQFPGHGGGVSLAAISGTLPSLAVTRSTISGNTAHGPAFFDPRNSPQGGGIFNLGAVLSLANDTVTGNTASKDTTGNVDPAAGGGIVQTDFGAPGPVSAARQGTPRASLRLVVPKVLAAEASGLARTAALHSAAVTTLDFVTLAGNTADSYGGAFAAVGKFSVTNSIVAGNPGGNCGNPGSVTSTGYNVESGSDCGFRETGDQFNVDPKLDALKLNAPGVTATMALLPGSPAIDAADPRCDQSVDERGVARPQGPRCDIGAFEVAQAPAATSAQPSPPVTGAGPTAYRGGDLGTAGAMMALVILAALGAGVATRRRRARAGRSIEETS